MKEYSSDVAAELAAFASILRDLQFTARACELVLAKFPPAADGQREDPLSESAVLRRSLWNSALVAYARCFASGVRAVRLSTDIFAVLGDKFDEALKALPVAVDEVGKRRAH